MLENDDKDESLPTAIAGTSIGSGTPHLDFQFRSGTPPCLRVAAFVAPWGWA